MSRIAANPVTAATLPQERTVAGWRIRGVAGHSLTMGDSVPPQCSYELWLDPGMIDVAAASDLLKPFDANLMRSYPVSTRINHVANDDEEYCRPAELAEAQNRVFS